jgi:hypothetical protein
LGWKPEIDVAKGVGQLMDWVERNRATFAIVGEAPQAPSVRDYDPQPAAGE